MLTLTRETSDIVHQSAIISAKAVSSVPNSHAIHVVLLFGFSIIYYKA